MLYALPAKRSTAVITATDKTVSKLNSNEVDEVSEPKFLGVTILRNYEFKLYNTTFIN